ncbi:MAG: hypothetical protein WCQ99_05725 [Pseudomonadota bacterium]
MNYDWGPSSGKPVGEATGTKLMAWGTPYGWLGASSFDLFDYSAKADWQGDRSYATFIVLGPKCRFSGVVCDQEGDVDITLHAVEALLSTTISNVTAGSLVTQAARGPGATQMKTITNGYNDTYTAYYLSAGQAAFRFTPAGDKPVKNPIFVIQNYTALQLPKISADGSALSVNTGAADSETFVSINTSARELWVTLNKTLTAGTDIRITP